MDDKIVSKVSATMQLCFVRKLKHESLHTCVLHWVPKSGPNIRNKGPIGPFYIGRAP